MQKIIFISAVFFGKIISAEIEIVKLKRDIRKAVQSGNVELLSKFLTDEKLNPVYLDNCKGYKMLAVASGFGQENVVELLLENGADINAINYVKPGRFTALDVAEIYKQKVIVQFLKARGGKHYKDIIKSSSSL